MTGYAQVRSGYALQGRLDICPELCYAIWKLGWIYKAIGTSGAGLTSVHNRKHPKLVTSHQVYARSAAS